MIKKVVAISDVHIRLFKRHDEYQQVFNKLYDELKELKPDRIILTGDIVHSKNQMTPELIQMVSSFLNSLSKICKVIMIPGNHDFVHANMERLDALTPIVEALDNDNIIYVKESSVLVDENVNWYCWSQLTDNNIPQPKVLNSNKKIGIFHGPIVSSQTDLGFMFEDGYDLENFNCCDFVICGDIHKRQSMTTQKGVEVVYTGSIIQQDFAEPITGHGYMVLDIDTLQYGFVDIENEKQMMHFRISSYEDIENEKEYLLNR